MHIQKSYKESKWEGRKMCARAVNGSKQLSYLCSSTFIFLECNSVLNATHIANAFLCCMCCFF